MTHQIGSAPVEEEYKQQIQAVASAIDEFLNPDGERRHGFVVMMFRFGDEPGRTNYMSNACREDVITLLKEQLAYFQGVPETSGRA